MKKNKKIRVNFYLTEELLKELRLENARRGTGSSMTSIVEKATRKELGMEPLK